MLFTMIIQPAVNADISAMSDLITQLGYLVNSEALVAMLARSSAIGGKRW